MQFKGIVDLVKMKARVWRDETLGAEYDEVEIPADLLEKAKSYREQMIEAVAESDDHLFAKFVEGTPISEEELNQGIRQATIVQKILPVKGLLPDNPAVAEERPAADEAPFSALVFKIMTDPFVGQLAYIRVYS